MTTYSQNLLLQLQVPGDPAVTNAWGTNLNNGVFVLVDNAVTGILSLSVAGSSDVILTSNSGAIDQSRQRLFIFSGILTGNIKVFYPQSLARFFTVVNNTTGSFTLTLAADNGSHVAAGTTVVVPQTGTPISYYSTGTNIVQSPIFGFGPPSTIASATTTDVGTLGTNFVQISGTTTITGLGSSASTSSPLYLLEFTGALTLTYNGTSLLIPGSANVTTAAGDTAIALYLGSGNWQILVYQRASGIPLSAQVALLNAQQAFTKAQQTTNNPITDASTITPDFSGPNEGYVVLGGSRTLGVPTGLVAGNRAGFEIDVYQDTTGSRTLAYAWIYSFASSSTPTLSTPGGSRDKLFLDVAYYNTTTTASITAATPAVVTWAGHGIVATGQKLQFTSGTLPTGLSLNTTYYAVKVDSSTFNVASSLVNAVAGTKINTTGSPGSNISATLGAIDVTLVNALGP